MTKKYNLDSTCALSGNRQLAKDFDIEKLRSTLESLIQSGYDTFLNGMANRIKIKRTKLYIIRNGTNVQ